MTADLHLLAPSIATPLGTVLTERLELRRFGRDDLDELAAIFEHDAVWQYPYGRGLTRAETARFLQEQIAHWDEVGFGCWAALERSSGRLVGYLGLSVPTFLPEILPAVEVGWRLHPAVWGHGYATEGARAALDEAFHTLGLDEVCSLPQTDNPASVRVAERIGLRLDRPVVVPANDRRGAVGALLFVIRKDEWLSRTAVTNQPS